MKKLTMIVAVAAFLVATGFASAAGALDKPDGLISVDSTFGKLPLYFIENQGQLHKDVGFYVQGSDKMLYFTPHGVTFALAGNKAESEAAQRWSVKLDFVGANPDVRPRGLDRQQAVISYFTGKTENWKTGLATYSRIVYPDLWPGIDLVYSGSLNKLKYEFVVKPGADPKQIRLAYRGPTNVTLNETGELMVETPLGGFADAAPYAYQEMNAQRVNVSMTYALEEESSEGTFEYGFYIGPYDTSQPVILDPAILIYCGYIGGVSGDVGEGIAVDDYGNAYVIGGTFSSETSFPVVVGPDLTYNGSDYNAFVAKVNADGTALLYCGYIGGTGHDYGQAIAVDEVGNAYVMGTTRSTEASFPVVGGPDLIYNGGNDAFVAKVNTSGTDLIYCGYIGGTGEDYSLRIAVDTAGNAYLTGLTKSTEASFPVAGGPDLTYNGGEFDAFVAKVNVDGTGLDYCGYIGGADYDSGYGIAVDDSGNAYVTGQTLSAEVSFPVVVGPDVTHNGDWDAFVAKVNVDGTALLYCGYIGGEDRDLGYGIAVDESGNAYVTGQTWSTEASFPVLVGPDLTHNGGADDAFIAKVSAAGTALLYCGYIGGEDRDLGIGIALDKDDNAYVIGATRSSEASFPVLVGPDLTYNGGGDAFVAQVNSSGTALIYCGYIGGASGDIGYGIAVEEVGNAYVTGLAVSTETSFPVVVGPDLTHNGGGDAFVAKISPGSPPCGPIAYWSFDNASDPGHDDSGNGNDGTVYGGHSCDDKCDNPQKAYCFDGVDDYVDMGTPDDLRITGALTATAWFLAEPEQGSHPTLVSRYGRDLHYNRCWRLSLSQDEGKPETCVSETGWAEVKLTGSNVVSTNIWHHLAMTYEPGTSLRVYLDGILAAETTSSIPGSINNPEDVSVYVGAFWWYGEGPGALFKGTIDEVRIYDRTLSGSEISELASECAPEPPEPNISVSPLSHDFGDVEIGSAETMLVSITNTGDADLTVTTLDFQAGSSSDFSITSAPTLPATVPPAATVDVEIAFSPSILYLSSATLEIGSDDADEPLVEVNLSGVGVWIEPPPDEQIEEILDFIDDSVEDGNLAGDGPGNSADKRLNALINMIEAAGDLIDDGLYEEAHQQLEDAYKKCDGQTPPPDFVSGPAASELAERIQNLMQIIKGAVVVTVDGLSFANTLLGPPYLDDTDHYLKTALEAMEFLTVSDSVIDSFPWSRDAGNTDSELLQLRNFLKNSYNTARDEGKKFVVVAHSWGTLLTYCALSDLSTGENPISCDLYITLSSPLGTLGTEYPPHDPPLYTEEGLVYAYTLYWAVELALDSANHWIGTPNTLKHHNFWAWGDPISGPLNQYELLPLPDVMDTQVDYWRSSEEYSHDYRNWQTCLYWHEFTKLQPDHPDNESLRNAVEDLIMQTLSE